MRDHTGSVFHGSARTKHSQHVLNSIHATDHRAYLSEWTQVVALAGEQDAALANELIRHCMGKLGLVRVMHVAK